VLVTKEISEFGSRTFEILPTTDNAFSGVEVPTPSLLFIDVVLNTDNVANRFVEVIEVAVILEAPRLVADKFVKNALVEVIDVPDAVVNVSSPAKFERLEIYKLVEVAFEIVVLTNTDEVANRFVDVIETAVMLVGLKFVADKFVSNALVEVIDVPDAVVNVSSPQSLRG
jgi:hypothetical protein